VEVTSVCYSAKEGIMSIKREKPDLVFLDIEMPGMTGIDLVRSFNNPGFRVVFITAFDAYAVEAFRLSAMDYLLKPVEADDIVRVIEKIKNDIRKNENATNIQLLNLEKLLMRNAQQSDSRIAIGMADKIVFVVISDILYCKAEGPYTHVYLVDGKKIVASKPLGEFEQQLITHEFYRIHHSSIINLRHVKEFQRHNGGYVVMDNNEKLEVSHRKRNDFLGAINDLVV